MRRALISAAAVVALAVPSTALAGPPANPGSYGTAAPNAQCGTGAASGAFNAHNSVYGPNSSAFGQAGGDGIPSGGNPGARNAVFLSSRQSGRIF